MEVLLIDDHPMVNVGIATMLESTGFFTVCGRAETLAQAMGVMETSEPPPSIVILDLILGEENGLDFLPMLKEHCAGRKIPMPRVLVCSALSDPFKTRIALKLGAAGFLSKTGGKAELLKALDAIMCGKTYISDELNVKLNEGAGLNSKFTKQETKVIDLIKAGKTNEQIAERLGINARTVQNYISGIYFKTGYSSRDEVRRL